MRRSSAEPAGGRVVRSFRRSAPAAQPKSQPPASARTARPPAALDAGKKRRQGGKVSPLQPGATLSVMREKSAHKTVAETQQQLDKQRTPTKKRAKDGSVKLERHPIRPEENTQGTESVERPGR